MANCKQFVEIVASKFFVKDFIINFKEIKFKFRFVQLMS